MRPVQSRSARNSDTGRGATLIESTTITRAPRRSASEAQPGTSSSTCRRDASAPALIAVSRKSAAFISSDKTRAGPMREATRRATRLLPLPPRPKSSTVHGRGKPPPKSRSNSGSPVLTRSIGASPSSSSRTARACGASISVVQLLSTPHRHGAGCFLVLCFSPQAMQVHTFEPRHTAE